MTQPTLCTITVATTNDIATIAQFQIDMAMESEGYKLDHETILQGVTAAMQDVNKGMYVVAKIEEKEARYLGKLNVILDEEQVIEKAIDELKDGRERTVMRYRYISGLKWEEICVKANYSWRQIHYIHSRALKNIIA